MEGSKRLAEAIQINTTLQELNISKNYISKEGVMRIVEACTINKTLHKLVCTHNNLSKSGLAAINEYIRKENAVQIFEASWNSIGSKNSQLAIKRTFQSLCVQQTDNDNIPEELWFIDEIEEKYRREFLHCCFDEYLNAESVNLSSMGISKFEVVIISDCLKINNTLCELNLSSNRITVEGAKRFAEVIKVNTTLERLNISHNAISDGGIIAISDCLKINSRLCELNLSSSCITVEGSKRLAEAIQINTTLQELNISKNYISKEGVMRIVEACTINKTLHKLVCTHNNLSKSGLAAINEYIRKENAVQIFAASWNSIGSKNSQLAIKRTFQSLCVQQTDNDNIPEELWFIDEIEEKYRREFLHCCFDEYLNAESVNLSSMGISKFEVVIISDCLILSSKVNKLNLSNNRMEGEGAKKLAEMLQEKTTVQILDISQNAISDNGVSSITDGLKINTTLCKLNLSNNQITDEGAEMFAEAIQVNTTLQELNISKNWISKEGIMRIVEACTINRTLHKLVCTHNNLSKSGLAAIIEYIRKENAVQIFDASWNSVIAGSRCGSQLVIPKFQSLRWSPDGWEDNLLEYDKKMLYVNNGVWNDTPCICRFTHDSLIELKFSINKIISIDIMQGIMQIDTLQKLSISTNAISDDGAIAFSECLKTNTTLIELDISWSSITYKGASAIAEAIQVNTILQKLNISGNRLSDDGTTAFI